MPKRTSSQRDGDSVIRQKKTKLKAGLPEHYEEDDSDTDDTGSNNENVENGASSMDFTSSIVEDSRILKVKKPKSMFINENASPGVILRVRLKNFMCHKELDVDFGSHVNFVVGRNGSGKSAIVTGLVIGLGGKAAVTNRGTGIKNFVKIGKRTATVEVELNNKTRDAYKPELYGDKIIIRRRFTSDGSSTYSISGASGKQVTDKTKDLVSITEHMNIQVDNPVSILNQDTSRNFLNTKSPSDKFKFFMRATQLEQMNVDYEQVKTKKESIRQILSKKETTLPEMKNQVRKWENKFKNLVAISDLRIKVKHLKHEVAWALIGDSEKALSQAEKSLCTEKASLPKYTQKVIGAKNNMAAMDQKHKAMEEKLLQSVKEVQQLQPMLQQGKKAMNMAKQKLVPVQIELRTCDRELRCTEQECQQCEKRIEELKLMASHDFEASRKEREEKIASHEATIEKFANEQRVIEHDLDQLRNAIAKYKTDIGGLDSQLKSKKGKLVETEQRIHTLQSAKKDHLHKFGQWIPDIVAKVKAFKNRFHQPPRGPLASEFHLKDQKWALALECCLKNLMTCFIVHDHHDEKLLEEIFNSCNCPKTRRPSIITCAFSNKLHNVEKFRVKDTRYICVLDIIQCRDPIIINTLIDQRSIENVLLIEDSSEARNVMMRNPPKDARECFTISGDQAYCTPTFRYYSSDKTTVQYLMANVEEQIISLKKEMSELETSRNEINRERERLNREIQKNQSEEKKRQTQLNKVTANMNRIKFEVGELQNVEDPTPVDVTTLEDEVKAYGHKMKELKDKRMKIELEKQLAEKELEVARENLVKVESNILERSEGEILIREEIQQALHNVDKAKNEAKHYAGKLKEQEKRIEGLNNEVSAKRQNFENERAKALEMSEPIPTRRKASDIETEIIQIQKRIAEEEEQHGNEEEITRTYHQKQNEMNRILKEVSHLKRFTERLEEVMNKRRTAYDRMRKQIAGRINYHFVCQMDRNNFRAHLDFNFDKQCLDIVMSSVKMSGRSGNITKDLKALSGGERSFSTVCFILSLWEAMESPFRCLDEFDVFMDMVNRRISMNMMMEAADMHKTLQFIFLTPQDMSSVKKISNVKIFHMSDPECTQNQQLLNFSQA